MSAHTAGPWRKVGVRVEAWTRGETLNGGWTLAETYGPQAHENATLVAAAPDLLAEIRKSLAAHNGEPGLVGGCACSQCSRFAAVVAKAEGRQS